MLSAEIALSGRVAARKIRGRALIGLREPSSIRLEGLAPFGAPLFILAANGETTTLLLPRENRALTGKPPGAVLEALTGVDLAPADLLSIMSGCVSRAAAAKGRAYGEWAAIDLEDGTTIWLKPRSNASHILAGTRNGLRVEYADAGPGGSSRVRLSIESDPARRVDLFLELSQVDKNVPLGPDAFTVKVPDDSTPIGLDELRDRGPLGSSASS